MKVELLNDARVWHKAGEIVEVSPAEAEFLLTVGAARPVEKKSKETPEQKTRKRSKA